MHIHGDSCLIRQSVQSQTDEVLDQFCHGRDGFDYSKPSLVLGSLSVVSDRPLVVIKLSRRLPFYVSQDRHGSEAVLDFGENRAG
jgi:hypothetical protein